jgi:hypothetical protein
MHWVWELHDDEVMNLVPEQAIRRKGHKDSSHEIHCCRQFRGAAFASKLDNVRKFRCAAND